MKANRLRYSIVGIFVILLGSLGVGISLWLTFGDVSKEYQLYRVYMTESVAGLYVDAPVRYRGVEVGRVRTIELDPANPERVRLTLAIERSVPIKQDTIATLSVQGLTGIASIELAGGSRSSPLLKPAPGETYPVMKTGPSLFTRLDRAVSELITNLNRVAQDAHALLGPGNRATVAQVLTHLEQVSATLAQRRGDLNQGLVDLHRVMANTARASERLDGLLARMEAGTGSVQRMADQVARTSVSLRSWVDRDGHALAGSAVSAFGEMRALALELRRTTERLDQVVDRFQEDPRFLLYGNTLEAPGPGERGAP